MSDAGPVLGVGIVGAGAVVQAIHLPVLARLSSRFCVKHIVDVDPVVAATVADRVGAAHSDSLDSLLSDPAVDVVVICSPPQFHAQQVIAAMRSGVMAVLCEKPLATNRSEAEEIARVSVDTNVPLVVGAMHTFDPGWQKLAGEVDGLLGAAHTIRSSIILPPNERFEEWATELISRPTYDLPTDLTTHVEASMMTNAILGLAIHDLPLIRALLPSAKGLTVRSAQVLSPYGYVVSLAAGGCLVQLIGSIHGHWEPRWEIEAHSPAASLHIAFPPSFVHAGSAVATVHTASGTRVFGGEDYNGYEGEWRSLHDVVTGCADAAPPVHTLVEDLIFAVDIATSCSEFILSDRSQDPVAI